MSNTILINNFTVVLTILETNLTISVANLDNNANNSTSVWRNRTKEQSVEDLELLSHTWQAILIALYSLTAALSLVGNIIAIWVLMAGKRSSRELRMFLVNLSLSDITMAIFSIPFTYTDFILGRWIFTPHFCPVVQFMQLTSVFVSVYTLTAIGIDRYVAIIYPLGPSRWYKSLGPMIVCIIWLLGLGLGSIIWYNSVAEPDKIGNHTFYDCKETWTEEGGRAYTSAIFIITFAFPMSVLLFVYGSVAWKMYRHSVPGNADAARDEAQHNAKVKVIIMLATIVILFAICWLPVQALSVLVWFKRDWLKDIYQTESGYRAYVALSIAAHWLSMANSFVNPIIYCFMSDNFRTDLKLLASKCCTRRQRWSRRKVDYKKRYNGHNKITFRERKQWYSSNSETSSLNHTSVFAISPNSSNSVRSIARNNKVSSLIKMKTMKNSETGDDSKKNISCQISQYSQDEE